MVAGRSTPSLRLVSAIAEGNSPLARLPALTSRAGVTARE